MAGVLYGFVLAAASAGLLWTARRRLDDSRLMWLLFAALVVRSALTVALDAASAWHLPVLASLQLGDGFWRFAPDAIHHHRYSIRFVEAWRDHVELPDGVSEGWFFLLMAGLYRAFGPHLLVGTLLNAVAGVATALVGYVIARRIGSRPGARLVAGLLAFWPSAMIWGTQFLKEQITMLLALATVSVVIALFARASRLRPTLADLAAYAAGTAVLAIIILLMATERPLYALTLAFATLVGFGVAGVLAIVDRRWLAALALMVTAVVGSDAAFVGRAIDLAQVFANPEPWVGRYTLGMAALSRHDAVDAEAQFKRALELDRHFGPAAAELRALMTADGRGPAFDAFVAELEAAARRAAETPQVPMLVTPRLQWSSLRALLEASGRRLRGVLQQLADFPGAVASLRLGQKIGAPGFSRIAPDADVSTYPHIIRYLPYGLAVTVLAPYPWEIVERTGDAGVFKKLSVVEMLFIYGVLALGVQGAWRMARRADPLAIFLIAYFGSGVLVLALTMVNLGSLFRYRSPYLLAPLLFACTTPWFQKAAQAAERERHLIAPLWTSAPFKSI